MLLEVEVASLALPTTQEVEGAASLARWLPRIQESALGAEIQAAPREGFLEVEEPLISLPLEASLGLLPPEVTWEVVAEAYLGAETTRVPIQIQEELASLELQEQVVMGWVAPLGVIMGAILPVLI